MNIYEGLLFLHGHVASVELARQLAESEPVVTRPACHEPRECPTEALVPVMSDQDSR
ncbi:hypothetical protein [Stenotrophomonas sp.]|uniref:hypothetical protein n=1 Tax=Stenotrophomonas sp. TaxID=69392 RepID=UPI00289D34FA|nr:hypothetical protein [Stenotrophomonas sp.]